MRVSKGRQLRASPDQSGGACDFFSEASTWIPECANESTWREHAPFAFWLIDAHKPDVIVELGTYAGYSYFSFCQAISHLKLPTRAYAIDTWRGDEHAGSYGEEIFDMVKAYNREKYAAFSQLIGSTFDDALPHFEDRSVDLLHIDGRHFYEDVKHDFLSWLPKLSNRAIALFHDTNVHERSFGVFQYWSELSRHYPHFQFFHGWGLGVLGVGKELPPKLAALFEAGNNPEQANRVKQIYARLGASLGDQFENRRLKGEAGFKATEVSTLNGQMSALQAQLAETTAAREAASAELSDVRYRLAEADSEKADLDAALKTRTAELAALKARFEDEQAKAERSRRELESSLHDHSRRIAEAYKDSDHRIGALEASLDDKVRQLGKMQITLKESSRRTAELEGALETSTRRLSEIGAALQATRESTSWRATAPIRAVVSRLRIVPRRLALGLVNELGWAAMPRRISKYMSQSCGSAAIAPLTRQPSIDSSEQEEVQRASNAHTPNQRESMTQRALRADAVSIRSALGVDEQLLDLHTIAIGVVIYRGTAKEELGSLVHSAYNASRRCPQNIKVSICICDNGGAFPKEHIPGEIKVITNNTNEGFGVGHNALMKAAFGKGAQIYIGANPDGCFHPDCIVNLLRMNEAAKSNSLIEAIQFPEEHPKIYDPKTLETPWISGACFLMPENIWRATGGFDPNIFLYCEDVDLSWTCRLLGFKTQICPSALFYHDVSDRAYEGWRYREMLISGRYLGYKWGNPEFVRWADEQLITLGHAAGEHELPPFDDLAQTGGLGIPDFSHGFHFAPVRWS